MSPIAVLLSAFLGLASSVSAHTWAEQLYVIGDDGNYTGAPGYSRFFQPRSADTSLMTTKLVPNPLIVDQSKAPPLVQNNIAVCSSGQSTPGQVSPQWPSLIAQPGDYVAMRYTENGHVTAPLPADRPPGAGLVFVYATTNNTNNPLFYDIVLWTANNTLEQGRLLAINNYDDLRCYQLPARGLAAGRDKITPASGVSDVACETNFQVPKDATAGTNLTLFWVWQWPQIVSPTAGQDEIYTTCLDMTVGSSSQVTANKAATASLDGSKYIMGVPGFMKAVSNYKERAANLTLPPQANYYSPLNPHGLNKNPSPAPLGTPLVPHPGAILPQNPKAAAPAGIPFPGSSAPAVPAGASSAVASIPTSAVVPVPSVPVPSVPVSSAPAAAPAAGSAAAPQYVTVTVTLTATPSQCIGKNPIASFASQGFGGSVYPSNIPTNFPTNFPSSAPKGLPGSGAHGFTQAIPAAVATHAAGQKEKRRHVRFFGRHV
ncbi:hypothetical protein BT63DRAFT_261891 [Microthyrium microscopicum]|uniref:DUF7492 domain-containing protein n=1 Tax=Microthyrium microscopicum TaxID=703497 RepID=A0A6A6UB43_9PEZI|nr:hypothetical protein BT63DRAFT_261891 [Microthyrium microscopicum]